ncbi:MAG TPA: hypothetical protein VEW66_04545, partial [Thermomicrobiales bacterium]|nr:hypothetical protein [Thermomicrobiales bacterium]
MQQEKFRFDKIDDFDRWEFSKTSGQNFSAIVVLVTAACFESSIGPYLTKMENGPGKLSRSCCRPGTEEAPE